MRRHVKIPVWLAAGVALLASAIAAEARQAWPAAATATPPAAGARIWFYRDYQPSVTLNYANVALNGYPVGSVPAYNGVLYRDVPAGRYRVSVDSFGSDGHQSADVDLVPGQQLYVKILVNDSWIESGDMTSFHRDTFDLAFMPPQVAQAEIANIRR